MDSVAYQHLVKTITKIKDGDQYALEKLVEEYRPFILKTVNQFCKRMLDWGRDEELSIGLIAFNSAIDTFDAEKQVPFLPYCRIVIANRLKDYVRKEVKHQNHFQLDDETVAIFVESQLALDDFLKRTIEDERRDELEQFENVLSQFSISFEDLVEVSPRHRDSRKTLFAVAHKLSETDNLMEHLITKKQLPLNELGKACRVNRKTLERGRKFIIASALILNRPDQFVYLRSYINFK
ncbi:MAG TPA: RNA polymerase sigma-I factor [Syntrophomonadaceae bacterium]|nr:RNA polymerase sigma-I factor [Syntrophomonadaceae bacterium]